MRQLWSVRKRSVFRPAVSNRISKCEVLKHFYADSRKVPVVFGVKSVAGSVGEVAGKSDWWPENFVSVLSVKFGNRKNRNPLGCPKRKSVTAFPCR